MVNRRSQPSSAISCLAGSYLLVGTCASAQITVEGNQSVQSAIDKAPAGGAVTVIAPGTYREVLEITRANITLRGSSKNASATVDVFDKSACDSGGTSQSATVNIRADGFTTESITFANDWNGTHTQSQAGSQALYSGKGRQYFVDSYIKGNVDLIFGDARAFFNYRKSHSTLHAVRWLHHRAEPHRCE